MLEIIKLLTSNFKLHCFWLFLVLWGLTLWVLIIFDWYLYHIVILPVLKSQFKRYSDEKNLEKSWPGESRKIIISWSAFVFWSSGVLLPFTSRQWLCSLAARQDFTLTMTDTVFGVKIGRGSIDYWSDPDLQKAWKLAQKTRKSVNIQICDKTA